MLQDNNAFRAGAFGKDRFLLTMGVLSKNINSKESIIIIGELMSTKEIEVLKIFIQERKLSGDYCAKAH
jgi:hypothetical protein